MNNKDTFLTIEQPAISELREKASKFYGFAYPVKSEKDIQHQLELLRKEHPKATHHCYAWRLGTEGLLFRANDDGEPSGTAGKPILGQIDKLGLTNVLIIVVRYFGGTLLGTSGLIQAYRESAALTLEQAKIVEETILVQYQLTVRYEIMPDVLNALKKLHIQFSESDYLEQSLILQISLRLSEKNSWFLHLKALVLKVSEGEAALIEHIPGLIVMEK